MSKLGLRVVALALVTALSGAADGRGLGLLSGFTRLFAGGLFVRGHVHRRHAHVRPIENTRVASHGVPASTNDRAGEEKPAAETLFTAPESRRQIAADAALALWHGGRNASAGWWSHGHGGYGWVGPLFWPFASNDIYGYTLFGDRTGFWDYGYADVYAALFGPYSSDELAAYMRPEPPARAERKVPPLQQFCGGATRDVATLAIGRIQQAIQPSDEQQAALDHLAEASKSAAQVIQASCPRQYAATAAGRLAHMQQRTAALIEAVNSIEPPLQELYDGLNDEQRTRLNALAEPQLKLASASTPVATPAEECNVSTSAAMQWPAAEIAAKLQPNDAQSESLERLRRASVEAADMLNYACRTRDAITPSERLAAVDRRLDALQQAVNQVSLALDDLNGTLSDEQKSRFERIGQQRAR